MGAIYKADNFFIYLACLAYRNYALWSDSCLHTLRHTIMGNAIAEYQLGRGGELEKERINYLLLFFETNGNFR